MSQGQLGKVMRQVQRLLEGPAHTSDRQLLDRFTRHGDQDAFACLVDRHGGMVLAVCRRVLADAHEAEDAFQATFLLLARKAAGIRWSDNIAAWLHTVAHRVACKARGQTARRNTQLREFAEMAAAAALPEASVFPENDHLELLQAELARLPEKYRAPLVLCYLEGKTNSEAAQALNCPLGSISKRLANGRNLLRQRLGRQGVALAPSALVGLLESSGAAAVVVSDTLRRTTIQAAAVVVSAVDTAAAGAATASVTALVEGVLADMAFEKVKLASLLTLTLSVFAVCATVFGYHALAADRSGTGSFANKVKAVRAAPANLHPQPRITPARTFRSDLPLSVFQLVEGEAPRYLGSTGVSPFNARTAKPINIPAGAVWYVQPVSFNIGFGQFGNLGGLGGGGGGLGALGMPGAGGGALGIGGGGGFGGGGGLGGGGLNLPKNAVDFSAGLTGDNLKKLVAEMKKQKVPGLCVPQHIKMEDQDLPRLATVANLRTLLLVGTPITDKGMEKLKTFQSLEFLALDGTRVTGKGLEHLAGCKMLRTLHLSGNKIDNKAMESLREAKSLTALRLHRTSVTADGLKALRRLPGLRTLELCGNFTDADLKPLAALTSVRKLKLNQTSITDAGLAALKALKDLESLTIDAHWDHNGIQPFAGGMIGGGGLIGGGGGLIGGGMPAGGGGGGLIGGGKGGLIGGGGGLLGGGKGGLAGSAIGLSDRDGRVEWLVPKVVFDPIERKQVKLAPPQFTAKGLAHLGAFRKLSELHVSNEKLTDNDMEAIGKLTSLKKLSVFAPKVTDKGIARFKDLKKLEMLDLRGTKATIAAAATLKGMPALKLLKINLLPLNPKSKAKEAEWRKQLPRVKVEPIFPALMSGLGVGGFPGGMPPGGFGGGGGFGGLPPR
jgi:RNA polymerase sigma-70 factor (ECF subfamily)